jgi:hypothetical protein
MRPWGDLDPAAATPQRLSSPRAAAPARRAADRAQAAGKVRVTGPRVLMES